jgi:hypothetical protein
VKESRLSSRASPDFLCSLVAPARFLRLSLTKATYAVASSAAYRKPGFSAGNANASFRCCQIGWTERNSRSLRYAPVPWQAGTGGMTNSFKTRSLRAKHQLSQRLCSNHHLWKCHPHLCHPERSRGTCGAPRLPHKGLGFVSSHTDSEGLGINPEDDLPAPACRGSAVGAAPFGFCILPTLRMDH